MSSFLKSLLTSSYIILKLKTVYCMPLILLDFLYIVNQHNHKLSSFHNTPHLNDATQYLTHL